MCESSGGRRRALRSRNLERKKANTILFLLMFIHELCLMQYPRNYRAIIKSFCSCTSHASSSNYNKALWKTWLFNESAGYLRCAAAARYRQQEGGGRNKALTHSLPWDSPGGGRGLSCSHTNMGAHGAPPPSRPGTLFSGKLPVLSRVMWTQSNHITRQFRTESCLLEAMALNPYRLTLQCPDPQQSQRADWEGAVNV